VVSSSESAAELEGVLFVVGDALMDVCAEVSRDFIDAHYLQLGRAIVATPQHQGHNIISYARFFKCVSYVLLRTHLRSFLAPPASRLCAVIGLEKIVQF